MYEYFEIENPQRSNTRDQDITQDSFRNKDDEFEETSILIHRCLVHLSYAVHRTNHKRGRICQKNYYWTALYHIICVCVFFTSRLLLWKKYINQGFLFFRRSPATALTVLHCCVTTVIARSPVETQIINREILKYSKSKRKEDSGFFATNSTPAAARLACLAPPSC